MHLQILDRQYGSKTPTQPKYLRVNLQSFCWGLIGSCQDDVPTVTSHDISKRLPRLQCPNLWCLCTETREAETPDEKEDDEPNEEDPPTKKCEKDEADLMGGLALDNQDARWSVARKGDLHHGP